MLSVHLGVQHDGRDAERRASPSATAETCTALQLARYSQFTPPDTTRRNSTIELRRIGRCELTMNVYTKRVRSL